MARKLLLKIEVTVETPTGEDMAEISAPKHWAEKFGPVEDLDAQDVGGHIETAMNEREFKRDLWAGTGDYAVIERVRLASAEWADA